MLSKKTGIIGFIIVLLACISNSYANNKTTNITFKLISNDKTSGIYSAELTLDNIPHAGKWQLAFNSIIEPLALKNARFLEQKQGGDFYLIELNIPENQKQFTLLMTGKFSLKNYTDAPSGYFLIDPLNNNKTIPLEAKTILPDWQPKPGEDEASRAEEKLHRSIEGNPTETTLTAETTLIIPIPAELKRNVGHFSLNKKTVIYYDELAKNSAQFFAQSITPATGYLLELRKNPGTIKANSILLTTEGTDSFSEKQGKEGYIVEIKRSSITIRALSAKGFFYGIQTLRQLMPANIYSPKAQLSYWQIPCLYIFDYPRFEYRGLMLDVARNFRSVSEIKRLLDLMAIHKLNYFHWHLTDDEGWRIEIKKYPQLTNIGAWRGYPAKLNDGMALMPAYGSGPEISGGFYTQQEIRDVVSYAAERQITIIPEIDLPGHARALIVSLKQLRDPNDFSQYISVQGYHDNILSLCNRETLVIIADILTEVATLFPGKYIHVGGDEVPKGAWQKSCMAGKYDPKDPRFSELVQNEFMQKIQTIIQAKGKLMAGWEEVAGENSSLAAPLRTYIWNASKIDQIYKNSENKGYEVIMSPAESLYLDLAYNADPKEPGHYWAGYVDTFSVYSFTPIDRLRGHSEKLIKGVQGQLWSEVINTSLRLDYFAFPKMSALAELGWSLPTRRNWQNFIDRMQVKHLQRLDYYGVKYRKKEFIEKPKI
ncbi:MAG: beta-N-acetylhexosaminidase [Tatlockia sp.]|nr:beta-N-acetylhexosaminidase [Tatlockia sp.]